MRLLSLITPLLFLITSSLSGQATEFLEQISKAYQNSEYPRVLELTEEPPALEEGQLVEALLIRAMSYERMFRGEEAWEAGQVALQAWEATEARDMNDYAGIQLLLGRVHFIEGDYEKAGAKYSDLIELFKAETATDTSIWLLTLADMAKSQYALSESQSAIETSLIAVELADQTKNLTPFQYWQVYFYATDTHRKAAKYERGLSLANRMVQLAKLTDKSLYADASQNTRSLIYGALGRYEDQEADILAIISRIKEGPRADYYRVLNYHNLAGVYKNQERYEEGLKLELRAIALIESRNYERLRLHAHLRLGSLYNENGEYDPAIAAFNEALKSSARADLLTEQDGLLQVAVDSLQQADLIRYALTERAKVLYKMNRYEDAENDLKTCLAIIEVERRRAKLSGSQYLLSNKVRPVYDNFVKLYSTQAAANGNGDAFAWRALQTSDQGKAYSLAAQVGKDRYNLTEAERQLRYRIAELERQAVGDTTLRTELAELRLDLQQIESTSEREGTTLTNLKRSAVERLLKDMSADLLAYHLNADSLYLIHYTPEGKVDMHNLGAPNQLGERINDWRSSIQQSAYREVSTIDAGLQATYDERFLEQGLSLKRQLIPDDLKLGKHVLIIPDGSLHYLPFAALPLDAVVGPVDYASLTYFGDGHDISYGYSLAVLLALHTADRANQDYKADLAAFAPRFGGNEEILAVNEFQERSGDKNIPGLRPLAYNSEEVSNLADQVNNTLIFVDEEATKERFIEQLGHSKILHLATHGLSDHENQQLSYVAFNQSSGILNKAELLYFNELPNLPIAAEMVVLSACETSLGPVATGESVLSMASAFTAGGARSTITTLWQVEDRAMQQMMGEMYAALVAGADRREALQTASQSLRNSSAYAHPKYWAGVHLHGQSGPIALRTGNSFHWSLIAGFFGALAGGLYLLFFKKNV